MPRRSNLLQRLWKPWFVYRPSQVFRRLWSVAQPPRRGYQPLRTSWGVEVWADPTRTIGRSILTTGLYDLAVSEVLARLIQPGDTVVDAGANVGYMTVLAALAAGPAGRVLSFEPHPELLDVVRRNIETTSGRHPTAEAELHNTALGERRGTAALVFPPEFDTNDGIARIAANADPTWPRILVAVTPLDEVLGTATAAVMKLDVEGFELPVLRGAIQALASRRVRHIVFEDHDVEVSQVVPFLQELGYRVLALGWALDGLALVPVESGRRAADYEAPSFVASLDADEVLARCRERGWRVLRPLRRLHEASPVE